MNNIYFKIVIKQCTMHNVHCKIREVYKYEHEKKKEKNIVKAEIENENNDLIEEKDNLFNKTKDLKKKNVSYTVPVPLANLLDEIKYEEKIDKSEIAIKALFKHLKEDYPKYYSKYFL